MDRLYTSQSEAGTEAFAAELAGELRPGDVIAFQGGLGAGKTTFVRGLARGLGLEADVSSPTFALIHEYRGGGQTLYHFDMYRIQDPDSLESTGYYDYLDAGGILAVEWSENIPYALPEHTITVQLEVLGENDRKIHITGGRGK